MDKNRNMVLLKDLNLTSRFLFDEVMEDTAVHRDALSIILGRDISLLDRSEAEKEFRVSPALRSIRMDIFSMDQEKAVYNSEMQSKWKGDLQKRSRYYQGMMDVSLLEPGVPNYNLLNPSFLILITTFDLFGYGRYRYTFTPQCQEEASLRLDDGATRIFLNTKGTNDSEESPELIHFLHYLENTTDEEALRSGSERIQRIHEKVKRARFSEEVGLKYMQAWEERYYDKQEAREEGLAEGRKKGLAEGREEGLMEGREKGLAEGRTKGLAEGREEGLMEGQQQMLATIVQKKLAKGMSPDAIADLLEEPLETVQAIIAAIH